MKLWLRTQLLMVLLASAGLSMCLVPAGCEIFDSEDGDELLPAPGADANPDPELDVNPDPELDVNPDPELDVNPDPEADVNPDAEPTVPPVVPVLGEPYTEALLTPNGRYLLAQRPTADGDACLMVADLEDMQVQQLEDLCGFRWITMAPAQSAAYLLSAQGNLVRVLDVAAGSVEIEFATEDTYSVMELSPDGDTLVLSNQPVTQWAESQYEFNTYEMELRHLAAIRPEAGIVFEQTFPFAIRSVAFSTVDESILVAMSWWKEDGLPEAQIHFMNPVTGVVEDSVSFPNCADEVAVQPEGTVALLAPKQCFVHPLVLGPPEPEEEWSDPEDDWDEWDEWEDADPTSVIDLTTREFVGNLPGFGPIVFSGDGRTAVAFSRQETLMKQWNIFQQLPVGLIIIRLEDLYWQVVEYGADEPDYFFDLTDEVLFLHDREGGKDRVVRMNVDSKELQVLDGLPTQFEGMAPTLDGSAIYTVFEGKVRLVKVDGEAVSELALDFAVSQVFARPQNDLLVVTSADNENVYLVAIENGSVQDSLAL